MRSRRRISRHGFKEIGLEQPVLMMPLFRPRIGKKHPNLLKNDSRWEGVDELQCFSPDKMTVGQAASFGFAQGSFYPVTAQIDADARLGGKFSRITCEKMPVSAADFQNDGSRLRQDCTQFRPKIGAALGDKFNESRSEIHRPLLPGADGTGQL